jgi:catechol 2,3-dioxygenase-like lactoylglutathione lyase family enzyme
MRSGECASGKLPKGLVCSTHRGPETDVDRPRGDTGGQMAVTGIVPQLRTTDMASSVRFYTEKLGFSVEFTYEDFYTGIRAGGQIFHLKLVDEKDPSIPYVDQGEHLHLYFETRGLADFAAQLKTNGVELVKDVHKTPWNTREFVIHDDQGHTLYFGERL